MERFHVISESKTYAAAGGGWQYTGVSVSIPAKSIYGVRVSSGYANNPASDMALSERPDSLFDTTTAFASNGGVVDAKPIVSICGAKDVPFVLYVWAKRTTPSASESVFVEGFYINYE